MTRSKVVGCQARRNVTVDTDKNVLATECERQMHHSVNPIVFLSRMTSTNHFLKVNLSNCKYKNDRSVGVPFLSGGVSQFWILLDTGGINSFLMFQSLTSWKFIEL